VRGAVLHLYWAVPAFVLLGLWEMVGTRDPQTAFFVSYPSAVAGELASSLSAGDLWLDAAHTLFPAVTGLIMGAVVGGAIGFALVSAPEVARRLTPAVSFLGAFPVFAIAPMTLVWFGLGPAAKVFLAFLGCVFVFLQAAHRGVPAALLDHFRAHGFSSWAEFMKLRLPHALDWLLSAARSGANLALLGVFIGEFVASERGLARVMINAGALYDVKRVLAAAVMFTALALLMMGVVSILQARRSRLIRLVSVPARSRAGKEA
jgi:NitT/TauT family transport system permease protein